MAFRFSLQSVLRYRRGLENQEEKKLLAAALAVGKVRAEIEKLAELDTQQRGTVQTEMISESVLGSVLQFYAKCGEQRVILEKQKVKRLQELEEKRKEQAAEYRNARQTREILEGLCDRQKAKYERELAQRIQQNMDEMFLVQKIREGSE